MSVERYREITRKFQEKPEYWSESAIADFTDDLLFLMEKEGINRRELAERLDTTPAYITKVLSGNANFTLKTMARLARALNAIVRLHLAPLGTAVHWREERMDESTTSDTATVVKLPDSSQQRKRAPQRDALHPALPDEWQSLNHA